MIVECEPCQKTDAVYPELALCFSRCFIQCYSFIQVWKSAWMCITDMSLFCKTAPAELQHRYRHSYDSKSYGKYDVKHIKVRSLSLYLDLHSVY